MTKAPPLLPAESFERVLRTARLDGMSVLVIASLFALLSASIRDFSGAAVGLLVAGAGAVELHGAGLLRGGELRGMRWLIGSQIFLIVVILGYVAIRLTSYDEAYVRTLITPDIEARLREAEIDTSEFLPMLKRTYYIAYAAVGVLTIAYQGGMMLFYRRRRAAVAAALEEFDFTEPVEATESEE